MKLAALASAHEVGSLCVCVPVCVCVCVSLRRSGGDLRTAQTLTRSLEAEQRRASAAQVEAARALAIVDSLTRERDVLMQKATELADQLEDSRSEVQTASDSVQLLRMKLVRGFRCVCLRARVCVCVCVCVSVSVSVSVSVTV